MDKILILDENEAASGFLGMVFQREHFLAVLASTAEMALQQIRILEPDIVIVSLPVPGTDSMEMCMRFQEYQFRKPIIILGDSTEEMDKVLALEAGADDYVVRPCTPRELVARVRAKLRRRGPSLGATIRFGNVEVDRERRTVTCHGQEVRMTPCEYKLLLFFLGNVDLALTRETLLGSVWGYSQDANTRTLDAHISKLRNKCEPDPGSPRHFLTVHGVGYRFLL